jgi:hypothetical protein
MQTESSSRDRAHVKKRTIRETHIQRESPPLPKLRLRTLPKYLFLMVLPDRGMRPALQNSQPPTT